VRLLRAIACRAVIVSKHAVANAAVGPTASISGVINGRRKLTGGLRRRTDKFLLANAARLSLGDLMDYPPHLIAERKVLPMTDLCAVGPSSRHIRRDLAAYICCSASQFATCSLERRPSFARMFSTWRLVVPGLMISRSAICALLRP